MYNRIDNKKKELDNFRPISPHLLRNLEEWFKVELTYTSNAIEGNTLSRQETALVVEKGITVRGKTINEHLEAVNHAEAIDYLKNFVESKSISEEDILRIHEIVLKGIEHDYAGRYRDMPVRISGSMVILPNYIKVPMLMNKFVSVINSSDLHPIALASEVHYELVTIHPFIDGNGRTARLLMNLILMQYGYPPAIIQKREREKYIKSLEKAQLGGSREDFDKLIAKCCERSLDIYLKALNNEDKSLPVKKSSMLKIGELSKITNIAHSTLKYYLEIGLLNPDNKTSSGYNLFNKETVIQRLDKIKELKAERYSIKEIAAILQNKTQDN